MRGLSFNQARNKMNGTEAEPGQATKEARGFAPTSLRLDEKTRKRIAYLAKRYGDNKTEAIRVAVRLLFRAHREKEAQLQAEDAQRLERRRLKRDEG